MIMTGGAAQHAPDHRTHSTLRGTILALASITVTTGVTVDCRTLARNTAVTLDTNTITRP